MNGFPGCLALLIRNREGSSGGGTGFFVVLLILGIIVFLVLRGRQDRAEQVGAPIRAMGSGPLPGLVFASPYAKCPACGASGEKMKQAWDGLRKVTWTCAYCGAVAGVQELKDEELPPAARVRLGLDAPAGMAPGQPGYYPPQDSGLGGIVTGMMLGSMLGGERIERNERRDGGDWGGGGPAGGDWGGGNDAGGDSGGGDWSDSGGGGDTGGEF